MFCIAANHPHRPFAADDFAVFTDACDAGSDFHVYRLTGKVVRKTKDEYCSTIPRHPQASAGGASPTLYGTPYQGAVGAASGQDFAAGFGHGNRVLKVSGRLAV